MSPLAGISVVIPTFGRSSLVSRLLESLACAAKNFNGSVEILIVDDSKPSEAEKIETLCHRYQARYFRGTSNVRQKRNFGIEKSQYPIVLFVDSDCEAAPNLFYEHAILYQDSPTELGGVVGVTDFVGEESWMWEVIKRTQFLNAFSFAKRMEFAPWATCSNTSYRKDLLTELGGFDTGFPFKLGADDTDLGLRLGKAGYRLRCNPKAVVTHTRQTWNSFQAVWRRAFRWGRLDLHLYYRKHRDRVGPGLPKFSQIFLMLTVIALIEAFLYRSVWLLALPLLWAFLVLIMQALITVRISEERWCFFPHEFLADVLGLAFEFGTLVEALKCREIEGLYKTVRRGPVLSTFKKQEWLVRAWSMWVGLMFILLIQGLLH